MTLAVIVASASGVSAGEPARLTVAWHGVALTDALRTIHEAAGFNVIVDASLRSTTVTLSRDDADWQALLQQVVVTSGLAAEQDGNVIRVAPVATIIREAGQRARTELARGSSPQATVAFAWSDVASAPTLVEAARSLVGPDGSVGFAAAPWGVTIAITDAAPTDVLLKTLAATRSPFPWLLIQRP